MIRGLDELKNSHSNLIVKGLSQMRATVNQSLASNVQRQMVRESSSDELFNQSEYLGLIRNTDSYFRSRNVSTTNT